jgi:hypothetical protein
VRLAVGNEPDVCLWQNQSGVATHRKGDKVTGTVRYGLAIGSSDLVGLLGPYGRWLAFEVKIADDPLRAEQELFIALVRSRGGLAAVLRFPHGSTEADVTRAAQAVLARARVRSGVGLWGHSE